MSRTVSGVINILSRDITNIKLLHLTQLFSFYCQSNVVYRNIGLSIIVGVMAVPASR